MITSRLKLPSMPKLAIAAALLVGASVPASAATYIANFTSLNGSGVTGSALLDFNKTTDQLKVTFNVTGLEPGVTHVAHIHGLFNNGGQAMNSTTPTMAQDTDGDGFIELAEGQTSYGDIILPLGDIGSSASGTSNYTATFNLGDSSVFANGFDAQDLMPFQLREIVIHGLTVPAGPGQGTTGEVNGTNGFLAVLPVASGEIQPGGGMSAVPEPATWALLISGFFGVGGLVRSRKKVRRRLAYAS